MGKQRNGRLGSSLHLPIISGHQDTPSLTLSQQDHTTNCCDSRDGVPLCLCPPVVIHVMECPSVCAHLSWFT